MQKEETKAIASIINALGVEDKTVRDPVHGDIVLNHLEVPVVDTERFQRLRRIRQLGTAHFVHTHRTKNSISAMAIEAVNFYYQSLSWTRKPF